MPRRVLVVFAVVVAVAVILSIVYGRSGSSHVSRGPAGTRTATTEVTTTARGPTIIASPIGAAIHKIQHVVVIVQENRSFDQYFGTFPGVDGLP